MSNEKVGAIRTSGGQDGLPIMYSRTHRGVDFAYDFMTKEERAALNGPVKTYFMEEGLKDE